MLSQPANAKPNACMQLLPLFAASESKSTCTERVMAGIYLLTFVDCACKHKGDTVVMFSCTTEVHPPWLIIFLI